MQTKRNTTQHELDVIQNNTCEDAMRILGFGRTTIHNICRANNVMFKRLLVDKRKFRSDKGKKRGPYKKTTTPLTHFHLCPDCATCVEGTESDTRASLARQIGGTWNEEEGSITCSCGWFMDCTWYRGEELVGKGWDGVKHATR